MPNWTESMQQTFEYYTVDPETWADDRRIQNVKSCSITRDSDVETLGSATMDTTDYLGECYVRVYMIIIQNGLREKLPLGTFLVQTPSSSFNGKVRSISMDAYTPLIELKEKSPPIGYFLAKDDNIMQMAYMIARENARAPVISAMTDMKLYDDFVAASDDTWITFIRDLIANAKYDFDLDELGRILFSPIQDINSLQPKWTYNDDNSSILYPDVTINHDLYDVPNVVEVSYSSGTEYYYSRAVNDNPNSPTSTIARGREIITRVANPDSLGNPTASQINEYAKLLLKNLSSIEYSVSYTHSYCPVRVGDCVRLNYERAGLIGIKAKVVSQTIKCEPGCPVTEKAVYSADLWGDAI